MNSPSSNEETVKPIISYILTNSIQDVRGDQCRFYDAVSSSAKFKEDEMSCLLAQLKTVCPNAPAHYLFQEQKVNSVVSAFGNIPELSNLRFHLDNVFEICEPEKHPTVEEQKVSSEDTPNISMLPVPLGYFSPMQECKVFIREPRQIKFYSLVEMNLEKCQELNRGSVGRFKNELYVRAKQIRLSSFFFEEVWRKRAEPNINFLDKVFTLRDSTAIDIPCEVFGDSRKLVLDLYKEEMNTLERGVCVEECGLVVNPTCPFLAASADGLVLDPEFAQPHGLVKVIFPLKYRNIEISEAVKKVDFCASVDPEGNMFLKKSHDYYNQIQSLLALSGRGWCDVVLACKGGINIDRVYKDDQHFRSIFGKLTEFYFTKCLPYLVDTYAETYTGI